MIRMANIEKRGDSYRITVSAGYDINGKQIKKYMTFKPADGMTKKQKEKELNRQATLFEEKVKTGQFINSNIKFAEFAKKWFCEYAEKQLKPKTIAQYKSLLPRINDGIGHIRLDRLQPQHIIALYDELAKDGIRADTRYKCKLDLKAELKQRKLTQKRLAELAGISVKTVEAVIRGDNVNYHTATKIAEQIEMPISKVFDKLTKGTLSSHTIRHHHILLSSILATAVQWQVIVNNPCDRVKPPKVKQETPNTLDDKQSIQLLEYLDTADTQHRIMIQLLIYLGLRREELLGLKWEDIDFDNSLISINRSIQYLPDRGIYESDTKTTSSHRVMKLPELATAALKEQKIYQNELRLSVGDKFTYNGYVFTTVDGSPVMPDSLTGWFRTFIKKTDLPYITVHSLRHTNATLSIANGMPLTTVAQRLGHANAGTTTKIYAHAIKSADEAAAEAINDLFTRKNA